MSRLLIAFAAGLAIGYCVWGARRSPAPATEPAWRPLVVRTDFIRGEVRLMLDEAFAEMKDCRPIEGTTLEGDLMNWHLCAFDRRIEAVGGEYGISRLEGDQRLSDGRIEICRVSYGYLVASTHVVLWWAEEQGR